MSEEAQNKILIVDNEVLSVIRAEEVLRAAGYEVKRLLSGAGFFAKLEYEQPQAVLLNLEVPGLQAESVLERLGDGTFDELLLVLFGGDEPEELQDVCVEHEAFNGYFSKSLDLERLPEFIASFYQ